MKKVLFIIVLMGCCICALPATIAFPKTYIGFSDKENSPPFFSYSLAKLKIKELEKTLGRKLTLKEKIAFSVVKWKIKHDVKIRKNKNPKDKGETAMIFGIIAISSLLIPYIGILISLVFSILALVFGYQAKKINPNNKKAKTAIILGWIAAGLYLLTIAIVIAVLSFWVK